MEILLIRHGESEADILNVHEGRADFSLTELGNKQARRLASRVNQAFPPEVIWSSTLKRAKETTSYLVEMMDCTVNYEGDLMEHNNGVFAGVSFEEAAKLSFPQHLHERFPEGESFIEFRMRIESVFSKIVTSSIQNNRIAIVAHGGVINHILQIFLKNPVTKEFWFKTSDTGIHLIEMKEGERLIHFLNDTSHLHSI
ncbi:histidine phosphatase family protein [Gracilibacillus alcaliphilus]|uniref:histidine phosphatase family protein n=1 Tax=Gracilibacillus alcaliphilus TaxID=1401441 RepID=UPI00195938FA|nr:histidine phosphatase family protein [Gracilibacillus alcaliphilus]MBM7677850.1 2,3-bisphosphoglycerate-dependent phosphoglycerate mutase [Gracilibacillus alcaliphilus]